MSEFRILLRVSAIVLLCVAVYACQTQQRWFVPPAHGGDFSRSGIVSHVRDGDTFDLCDGGDCIGIRLCGIDAPERNEPRYKLSKLALVNLIEGRSVRCTMVGSGTPCDGRSEPINSDRLVAQCFVGGTDIAAEQVHKDMACDWVKFSDGYYSKDGGRGC